MKFYQLGIIPSFSGVINTSSCRIIKMSISSEAEQQQFLILSISWKAKWGTRQVSSPQSQPEFTSRPSVSPHVPFFWLHVHKHTLWRLSAGAAQVWFFSMPLIFENVFCWLSLRRTGGKWRSEC